MGVTKTPELWVMALKASPEYWKHASSPLRVLLGFLKLSTQRPEANKTIAAVVKEKKIQPWLSFSLNMHATRQDDEGQKWSYHQERN